MLTTIPKVHRNKDGWYYVRWSEKDDAGAWRSKRQSLRTKDQETAKRELAKHLDDRTASGWRPIYELLDAYEQGAKLRGIKPTQMVALRPIRAAWGLLFPTAITPDVVAEYVQKRSQGLWTKGNRAVKPATIRRELEAATAAFKWCVKKRLLSVTDLPDIDLPPKAAPREVFLTEPDADHLINLALLYDHEHQTRLGLFCALATDCCARAESIERLSWGRVSFDRNQVDFREPGQPETTKRRAVVPMSLRVSDLLLSAMNPSGAGIPVRPPGNELVVGPVSQHLWRKFTATTPWPHLTRHDLRRTGASLMIARGVDLMKVAKMLGDDPRTVMKHYARFAPDYLADVHTPRLAKSETRPM